MKKKGIKEIIINSVLDLLIVLFSLILLVSIYNGIQTKMLGNSYSNFFGYSFFEIQTGSMEPVISAGDWIIVKKKNKYNLNDIVTFESEGNFITHRIIESYKGTYITQGDDNNTKDDNSITNEQIAGEVVKILPSFGIMRKTIFNPIVIIFIIITIYLISTLNSKSSLKFKGIKKIVEEVKNKNKDFEFKDFEDNKISLESIRINDSLEKKDDINDLEKIEISTEENLETNNQTENDILDKELNQTPEEKIDDDLKYEADYEEDDLDKTVFFRAVSVNKSEINDTLLKAAEFSVEEPTNVSKIITEDIDTDDEETVKINLELIEGNKSKKFKTIFDRVLFIKKTEINEMINIIINNEKLLPNEPTIKEQFIDAYIDSKYYNFCGDINTEYSNKNKLSKLENILKEFSNQLVLKYKGTDKHYSDKVKKFTEIFTLLLNFEHCNDTVNDINSKKEYFRKKLIIYSKNKNLGVERIDIIIDSVVKTQRIYESMINYSLKKLETSMFELVFNKINTKTNLTGVSLKHNITFSKVYSDYIIDRTYTEGIIAENKIEILLNLLSVELIKNMLNCEFDKKYLIYLPDTIYKKDNKISKVQNMLNNEFIKNNIVILIKYSEIIRNKKVINKLKKSGFNFDIVFTKCVDIKDKDVSYLYLANSIFMDKKTIDTKNLLNQIPKELIDNIIFLDLLNKFDDLGGDN